MIETKRFILRKFELDDAEMMFNNWASDEEVTKYLTWEAHQDINVTKAYLDFVIKTKQMNFAIVDKKTKEAIGAISNVSENADFSSCEVGYCLSKKYWNQGIMTEVLEAYIKYLFEKLNYETISAKHNKDNPASGRVMTKAGFRYNYSSDELSDKFGWMTIEHYFITYEEYLMKKFQKEITEFFNIKVPTFLSISKTMKYLENNGFLVKKITLIESSKINLTESDLVYNCIDKSENILDYYFISKPSTRKSFNDYLNKFIMANKEYIICDNDKTIEQTLVNLLKKYRLTIAFAESCTGGLMASSIVNISGASDVIKESYVVYSEEAKRRILGVSSDTLNKYSVYSKQTAYEMARGLRNVSNANICVSITGLAGSTLPTANDGSYHSAIILNCFKEESIIEFRKSEKGTRNSVRTKQKNYIFYQIIKALEKKI